MRRCIALIVSFALLFGTVAAADGWVCPSCGFNASGNFCGNCGTAYSIVWTCPQCENVVSGNYCFYCGTKKPEDSESSQESSASILDNKTVKNLISSCPAISNNTKITLDYFDSVTTYNSMFKSGENKVWQISIQKGVIYFADESNMTILTVKSTGTPAELIPVLQWEISVIEAIPSIKEEAERLGVSLYVEKRVKDGDYASYADSDGVIDLLVQSKYDGVLKKEHDNLGLLQTINAFSGLESLDTNENGRIDYEDLFTSNSNSSNGWYVSNDGKYAIRPYNMRKSGNGYLVTIDIRSETAKNEIGQLDLTLKTEGAIASLKSDEAVQDFVTVGDGEYQFKIACDYQLGIRTITMTQEFSVSIK